MLSEIIDSIKLTSQYVPCITAVYRFDKKLERLFYTDNLAELMGYSKEEFENAVEDDYFTRIFPSDREAVKSNLIACIESNVTKSFVFRLHHKRSDYIWVHASTKLLETGVECPAFVVNFADITYEMLTNRVVLNAADAGITLIDSESREVLYANPAFLRISGSTEEECIGKKCNDVICRMGEWDEDKCVCFKLKDSDKSIIIPSKDGRLYQTYCKNVAMGEHQALAYYMRDVTEQESKKLQVEQLQRSVISGYQQQIDTLMKLNPGAVSTFRLNITENTCFSGVSNYPNLLCLQSKGTCDGYFEDALEFIPQKEWDFVNRTFKSEILLKSFEEGITQVSGDMHYRLDEGEERLLRTTVCMVENPVSHHIEGVVFAMDITKENLYDSIMSKMFRKEYEGASVISTKFRRYTLMQFKYNESIVASSKNMNYDDGVQKFVENYVVEEEKESYLKKTSLEEIEDRLGTDGAYSFTAHLIESDGETRLKKVSYFYLDEGHETILTVTEDITDITRKEQLRVEQLNAALLKAEKATKAKQNFFSSLSHDMRTPMNAILGLSNLAMDCDDMEEIKSDIIRINESGRYLLSLINDVLDISRIETGKMELNPRYVLSSELMDVVVASTKVNAAQKGVIFNVELKNFKDKMLYVDDIKITKIFVNLLSNAVKFTPAGNNVTFTIESLGRTANLESLKVSVADTGIGISEEFLPHIFEPFRQESPEITANYAGTGLGMSIVKSMLELMGARIEIHSKKGKGTTFDVFMECAVKEKPAAEKAAVIPEENVPAGKRILLCEDHPLNAQIAQRLLEKKGYAVDIAQNGKIGVDKFNVSAVGFYSAILMDIRMPVMDGLEATRLIRNLNRADAEKIPVIAMTANAFAEDVEETRKAGMNAHLSKPINPAVLFETLSSQIGI